MMNKDKPFSPGSPLSQALPLESIPCPLCAATDHTLLFVQRDVALGVPGSFSVVRCSGCGLIYQNPRVSSAALSNCYPANYPPHAREPEFSSGCSGLDSPVRWVLVRRLGYLHLGRELAGRGTRLRAFFRRRRIFHDFPPFLGQGRLLDVGCATGRFLRRMAEAGWKPAGIEISRDAASQAMRVTREIFVGDPVEAPFSPASFDLITAFHVLEHLPDPLTTLRCMIKWLAPGGLIIVEVPNVTGWGGQLFGKYWSGLELPRHLTHFSPQVMRATIERAGGLVIKTQHKSKPRYFIRSLCYWLQEGAGIPSRLGLVLLKSRIGAGLLKLSLEGLLPIAELLKQGEVVRYFIRRRGESRLSRAAWRPNRNELTAGAG